MALSNVALISAWLFCLLYNYYVLYSSNSTSLDLIASLRGGLITYITERTRYVVS